MEEEQYSKLKRLSKLLEDKDIKIIVEEILEGYELTNDEEFIFSSKSDDKITLSINKDKYIELMKISSNKIEVKIIDTSSNIREITYELRTNGIIITEVMKIYGYSRFSKEKKNVTSLYSDSYVLTKDKINNIYPVIISNGEYNIERLHEIIDISIVKNNADLVTNFETHMMGYGPYEESKKMYNYFTTRTYLNGEDISYIYDIVEGPDKLLRIYDLYNGLVNRRNYNDIFYINIGCLRSEGFYLKEVKGIVEQENNLVSEGIDSNKPYLEGIALLKRISPTGGVCLDSREELLKSIRIYDRQKLTFKDEYNLELLLLNYIGNGLDKVKIIPRKIKEKIKSYK